ncbi:MAG: AI-2E family transporter [Candidatus Sumerlaeia bacterium]|nr:AI-2E family transporter [Candidatus Sumerlaeia bacterium]
MSDTPEKSPIQLLDPQLRRIALIIGVMVIAAGGILALTLVWPVVQMIVRSLMPFVVGLIFAYIFDPIVTFIQVRLRLSRIAGVLFLYLCFILAITAFFALLLPILIKQVGGAYHGTVAVVTSLLERNPEIQATWDRVREWLREQGIDLDTMLFDVARSEGARTAAATTAMSGAKVVGAALIFFYTTVTSIFGTAAFLVFAVLVNIYLLVDFSKIRNLMEVMTPVEHHERSFDVLAKVDVAVGGFIRGMLICSLLVGVMTFVGLTALGMGRFAALIAVMAALGNLIPYMGAVAGGVPALLYVIFSSGYESMEARVFAGIGVLVLTAVIQTVESLYFQPKIVGKSAQLNPITVLFALAVGANFGLLGMIVAVPAACIVRVLLKEFYWDKRELDWRKRTGKTGLSDMKGRSGRKKRKRKEKPVEIQTDD